jgi:hypothetical protein
MGLLYIPHSVVFTHVARESANNKGVWPVKKKKKKKSWTPMVVVFVFKALTSVALWSHRKVVPRRKQFIFCEQDAAALL